MGAGEDPYDQPLNLRTDVADQEAVDLLFASCDGKLDYYSVVGLYQTNFAHVEYAQDRAVAKICGRLDFVAFQKSGLGESRSTASKTRMLREGDLPRRCGAGLLERLIHFDSCRDVRNDLSHAMSGNGASELRFAKIGQLWQGDCDVTYPPGTKVAAGRYSYSELIRRAIWLRAFQRDLFEIGDDAFWMHRRSIDAPLESDEFTAPPDWTLVTQNTLESARATPRQSRYDPAYPGNRS